MELFKQSLSWMVLLSWLQAALRGDGFLIKNIRLEKCLHASSHEAEKIGLADCKPHSLSYGWLWDPATHAVVSQKTGECLTVSESQELALVHLEACGGDRRAQAWACSKKGHLTLQGSGLHLSTKPGGHKAFLSQEKDKFSRWKTTREEVICATDHLETDPGFSDLTLWVPESKMTALPAVHILSVDKTTTPPAAWEDEDNATSILLMNESINWAEDQDRYDLHNKNHQTKAVASQQSGSNWVTMMLVLSPLAFIVGVIILLTNIHHKKKKKALSALQTRQVVCEEHGPLPGVLNVRPEPQNASPSPSLRHGEILIEWKDGTITPLFNSTNSQIC